MKVSILILMFLVNLSLAMNPGTASAAFLRLSVDARAVGMGEGVSAYCRNISSLYYNPAGLAEMGKYDFLFMHNQWLVGMYHEYGAVGYNAGKMGGFGMSFNYWGSGTIQGIDERGDTIRINGSPYTFSASAWSVGAGYGYAIANLSLGAALKYVAEKNESLSDGAVGLDLGARFHPPLKGVSLAFSVSNAGTGIVLDEVNGVSFPLPLMVRFGAAYRLKAAGITSDIVISNSDNVGIGLGGEYWLAEICALRLGYKSGSNVDGLSGLRAGLGVKYKALSIDYAFAPYGSLGMAHRISLGYGLDPAPRPTRVKRPAPPVRKK